MKNYGLIGKSLGHSFSKKFFTEKFEAEAINAQYHNVELSDITLLGEALDERDFNGLNVTIPYKESIKLFLDDLSDEARTIGAVNTIKFDGDDLIGHNTDAFGFAQSIKPFLRNIHHRALILGTGGASKAVSHVFNTLGLDCLYVSREPINDMQFKYEDINSVMVEACKVVVNCTPVGTFPNSNEMPNFPTKYLSDDHLVIDLIYNPAETLFLKEAKKKGAQILNGESMLKEQALKSWEIWNS